MSNLLIHRGDFTLANGGNCTFRFNGSSFDGLMADRVSRKSQEQEDLTVLKPARLFPKVETSPQRSRCDSAPPPRRQRRGFRCGEIR